MKTAPVSTKGFAICSYISYNDFITTGVGDFMRNNQAKTIALGGMLAAFGLAAMCIGGMIPIATYVCPAFCMILLAVVLQLCGRRIAWAWYAAVSFLCLILSPDKEAAIIFLFLGYYPIIKSKVDRLPLQMIIKFFIFNIMILLAYLVLIGIMGMGHIAAEFRNAGIWMTALTMLLGNICLYMLDYLLNSFMVKFNRKQ